MELIDLLDKSERRQVEIIFTLLDSDGKMTVNGIADKMSVYRNTIKDDLVSLRENISGYGGRIDILLEKDEVQLVTTGELTTLEVIHEFMRFSINYQILMYILDNGNFEIPALAQTLSISVATLSRRIRYINELLEEFELNIRNGKIIGTEMQIRYFYYSLLWYGTPYHQALREYTDHSATDLVNVLEKNLRMDFNDEARVKMQIWMYITKRRLRLKICEENQILTKGLEYKFDDSLYRGIYTDLARYFSRYAYTWDTDEVTLFYLFMVANFTIEIHKKQNFLLYEEAKQKNYYVYRLNENVKKQVQTQLVLGNTSDKFQNLFDSYLYQLHTKIYYFRGFIYFFGRSGVDHLFNNFPDQKLLEFCHFLVNDTFDFMDTKKKERKFRQRQLLEQYSALMYVAFRDLDLRLNVACDFPFEQALEEVFIDNIFLHTDVRIPCNWLTYDAKNVAEYDVVITNIRKDYPEIPKEKVYVLFSIEYNFDMKNLNEFIRENYREKLFRMVSTDESSDYRSIS